MKTTVLTTLLFSLLLITSCNTQNCDDLEAQLKAETENFLEIQEDVQEMASFSFLDMYQRQAFENLKSDLRKSEKRLIELQEEINEECN